MKSVNGSLRIGRCLLFMFRCEYAGCVLEVVGKCFFVFDNINVRSVWFSNFYRFFLVVEDRECV